MLQSISVSIITLPGSSAITSPIIAASAVTVTMPYQRAYAAPLPRHRWQIILPGTGEVLELDEVSFAETWVLESECPPAVLKLFDGFESYARWRWGK